MTEFLLKHNIIDKEEKDIYNYGFISGIELLFCLIINLLIAMIRNYWVELAIVLAVFIPLRSYVGGIHMKSINSCLYASISSKTSVFIGFSRPFFLFLSPSTPFLHHFTFNYTFSRTFPFPRTACPLLRGNTSPLSFVMCHVPKVSVMFWGSCHIRLLL